MQTFFARALDDARAELERNTLEVAHWRSNDGDALYLDRAGVILAVTLDRSKPAIIVKVGDRVLTELFYDLERAVIVTGTRRRPPNLQAIFSRAMSVLIDQALGKPH